MPALTKTCSSRPTPPWRPLDRNSPPQQGKGGNAAAEMTPACPKPTKNQSYAKPAQPSRPEYPSQSPTHHADTQISPITLKCRDSKTPREKSGSYPKSTKPIPFRTQLPDPAHFGPTENTTSTHRHSDPPSRSQIQRYKMASVESRKGAVVCTALASHRFPSPLISRVGYWRASCRVRWLFHCFRSGPQSGSRDHVSSSRLVKRGPYTPGRQVPGAASAPGLYMDEGSGSSLPQRNVLEPARAPRHPHGTVRQGWRVHAYHRHSRGPDRTLVKAPCGDHRSGPGDGLYGRRQRSSAAACNATAIRS